MNSHKIGMFSLETTRGLHVLYNNCTFMFGQFDFSDYISLSFVLLITNKVHKQHDVCAALEDI